MKLIFLNRFFHPDHSATSQMLSDLAFALAERGHAVSVIASRQRYDAPAVRLAPRETATGVSVYRVWTSRFGRSNLVGRTIDYATFYLSAGWCLWRLAESGDVVVAKTDPPMLSVIAAPVCWLRRAHLVNWLQDLFPETAQVLGVGRRAGWILYGLMRWFRNRSLAAARMNVVLGERMAERVRSLSVVGARVCTIPNWSDRNIITPVDHAANALRAKWNLNDAFVAAYSGNLGRVHEIDTVLKAIAILEGGAPTRSARYSVRWLFIGGGALLTALKTEVARRGLTSVDFKPYQAREDLSESLSAGDVHLVSLRPEFEGLIVPSKFYGICAAGRPTIFIGGKEGEIAHLVARYECGRTIAMGDGAGLAQTILELAEDSAISRQMGENARRAFETEFDKPIAIARWEDLLLEVAGRRDA